LDKKFKNNLLKKKLKINFLGLKNFFLKNLNKKKYVNLQFTYFFLKKKKGKYKKKNFLEKVDLNFLKNN
jgi:hypothetical protein